MKGKHDYKTCFHLKKCERWGLKGDICRRIILQTNRGVHWSIRSFKEENMNFIPLVLLVFGLSSTLAQNSTAAPNSTTSSSTATSTTTQSSTTATTQSTSKAPPATTPRPSKAIVTISILDSKKFDLMFCYCYISSISLLLNLHTNFQTSSMISV